MLDVFSDAGPLRGGIQYAREKGRKMARKRLTLSVVLATILAVLTVSILYVAFWPREKTFGEIHFADRTMVRIILPPSNSGQEIRYDYFADDLRTRLRSVIEYRDGSEENMTYRADGTRMEASVYFPSDPQSPQARKLKAKARYALDGKTYAYHEVYRLDGSLERQGEALGTGYYRHRYYLTDGKTVERERLFDEKREFFSEKRYRSDGTLSAQVSKGLIEGELAVTYYRPDGVTRASMIKKHPYNGEMGEVYAADGNRVVATFERSFWLAEERYFNDAGVLVQIRQAANGTLTIKSLMPDRLRVHQIWYQPYIISDKPIPKRLRRVEVYAADGKTILQSFSTSPAKNQGQNQDQNLDKVYVSSVTYPNPTGYTVKYLNEDGSVRVIQERNAKNEVLSETEVRSAEIVLIPAEWFDDRAPVALPVFKESTVDAPPMIYDYP